MATTTRTLSRTHGLALGLILSLVSGTAFAQQECAISGPSVLCGAPVELCGPAWGEQFMWVGPDGSGYEDRCIVVTMPGTYTLQFYDADNNMWFGPCQQVLTTGEAATAQITGPASGCDGSAVELCGPLGTMEYSWSGPGGFASSSACMSATVAGSYWLRVRQPGGCWGDSVEHALSFLPLPSSSISGPAQACEGASAQLCGPAGSFEYAWSGPGGVSASTACVNATAGGAWSLRVREPGGCWSDAATHDLSFLARPASSISGPANACTGAAAQLCGPAGMLEYEWSGPGGFAASTSCVSATAGGDYTLRVRAGSCWSEPATHLLTVASCGGGKQCPAPAWWWARSSGPADQGTARLPAPVLTSIGSCVDAAHISVNWSDPAAGLAAALSPSSPDLRARARKQFVAVSANVCAGRSGSVYRGADVVKLDANTMVNLEDYSGSVSSWLVWAEREMARLQSSNLRDKDVKRAYRRVVRSGWDINHGHGIGPVCDADIENGHHEGSRATRALEDDPEPLEAELDGDESVVELAVDPNPFVSSAAVSFAVPDGGRGEVSVGVYDVSGRLVANLASGTYAPGYYRVAWNGRDASGSSVRGGLYFVQARVNGAKALYRVTLIR